jgi:hypothetical protein
MKPERVCEISLRFQPPNTIIIHLHSFKTITRFPFYFPSFSQLPRLIILFFLKKLVGISIIKIELKIMSGGKVKALIIRVRLLKRRRKKMKVDPKLGGQWKEKEKEKVLHLVANGRKRKRLFAWWPMEGKGKGSLLGGQWKEKEKVIFYLFPLSPQATSLRPSFFIL